MENFVVIGFENSVVRFFRTTNPEQPREDRLHSRVHRECKNCPSVETLSFSNDGLVLLASIRGTKSGTIQVYAWPFPFLAFHEVTSCRYHVPFHESEDNGITSAIFRSGPGGSDNLICITTWTQPGIPLLIQPDEGHRSEIKSDISSKSKLGSRIQCASFSPLGSEIAMVNDKGHVYKLSSLNSSPIEIKRVATTKELTSRSESFAMSFMSLPDEDAIVVAWVDGPRGVGFVKKIPVGPPVCMTSCFQPFLVLKLPPCSLCTNEKLSLKDDMPIAQTVDSTPRVELPAEGGGGADTWKGKAQEERPVSSHTQKMPVELAVPDEQSGLFRRPKGLSR